MPAFVRLCLLHTLDFTVNSTLLDHHTYVYTYHHHHHHHQNQKGFSFRGDGPLDMRMQGGTGGGAAASSSSPAASLPAPAGGLTAAEIVNEWDVGALTKVLKEYGEEPRAYRLARAMVSARPLETTAALRAVVERHTAYADRPKVLARVFQVNKQLKTTVCLFVSRRAHLRI